MKKVYQLEGKRRTENIIYKCIVSTFAQPDKAYLGTLRKEILKKVL